MTMRVAFPDLSFSAGWCFGTLEGLLDGAVLFDIFLSTPDRLSSTARATRSDLPSCPMKRSLGDHEKPNSFTGVHSSVFC